jgi:H+-translocating NAD(P) transhydrogenase subunit alpha
MKRFVVWASGLLCAAPALAAGHDTAHTDMGLLWFVFAISIFLGVELIAKVPSQLHTPLMSGSNAISGITIVGALIAAGSEASSTLTIVLGVIAVASAVVNVVGGYLVTDRMLAMFRNKGKGKP